MSLLGSMHTGVSGMNAQSVRIGSVAENIANSSTTGYKKSSVEFESVLGNAVGGGYTSGSVASHMRYGITQQGAISSTSNVTDLAIDGEGFFVVASNGGEQLLTRSGSFVFDSTGRLVNSSGHILMGYAVSPESASEASLAPIQLPSAGLMALPSSAGAFSANLPSDADIIAADDLPSANSGGAMWSAKSSLVAYDNLGAPVTLDLYFARNGESSWEVSVFQRSEGGAGNSFPLASGPLFSGTLQFDGVGKLAGPTAANVQVPNGAALRIDLSRMTQLAAPFSTVGTEMNGSAPARADRLEIAADGSVTTVYENGGRVTSFRIPLANVASASQLRPADGNTYAATVESGPITLGDANGAGWGKVVSSSLEASTVDIASELTDMIQAQRNFTANSRVFQTSSELLDVLNRL